MYFEVQKLGHEPGVVMRQHVILAPHSEQVFGRRTLIGMVVKHEQAWSNNIWSVDTHDVFSYRLVPLSHF